jgi:DNA polymerase III delta prime subunit
MSSKKKRVVIGFQGLAGSGKSTAALILAREFGFARKPMAYPIKAMLAALGVPKENLDGTREDKEVRLPLLNGYSARYAMQTLGTEWARAHLGEDFWINWWKQGADIIPGDIVVDDIRFANEVDLIRSMGGLVVRLRREGAGDRINPIHASEQLYGLDHDRVIVNNGDEGDLREKLAALVDDVRAFRKVKV